MDALDNRMEKGAPPAQKRWGAFRLLALVQATLIFTIALIMIPLPQIAAEFRLSEADVLMLQVAYGLPFSSLLLFGGRLADRFAANSVFAAGIILFGASSVLAAVSPDFISLLLTRCLQGIGGALIAPAALAIVRASMPSGQDFERAMAVWGGVSVLGAVVGFVSSGLITQFVSWRWMFVVPTIISLVCLAAVMSSLFPKAKSAGDGASLDIPGACLATIGIALTSVGLIGSHDFGWGAPAVLMPIGAGLVAILAFLGFESRVPDPLLPPGFLRNAHRMAGLNAMFSAAAGSVLVEFVLLLYLQDIRGWTAYETAMAFVPFAGSLIAANFAAASLVDRWGPRTTTSVGFVVAAMGLAGLATLNLTTPFVLIILPSQIAIAVGISLVFSGGAVLATYDVAPERMGLAGGVMNTAMELGPTVGLAVLIGVATLRTETVSGYATSFGAAAAVYVLAAIWTAQVRSKAAKS